MKKLLLLCAAAMLLVTGCSTAKTTKFKPSTLAKELVETKDKAFFMSLTEQSPDELEVISLQDVSFIDGFASKEACAADVLAKDKETYTTAIQNLGKAYSELLAGLDGKTEEKATLNAKDVVFGFKITSPGLNKTIYVYSSKFVKLYDGTTDYIYALTDEEFANLSKVKDDFFSYYYGEQMPCWNKE